ncbi:MAG: DUF1273 domain-containing protein [Oscillospiraceae bacterium]|nr:DUF1273 domain-containing protein [Oscillospiraceae bacterium]
MNFINKVCSFTGYRSKKLCESLGSFEQTELDELKDAICVQITELINRDFTTFQCGMALGADMIFADAVLELKKKYSLVKFIAVIPCIGQEKAWKESQQIKYRHILENADEVIYVSDTEYFDGCMQKRNRYLVDTCELLLAVYDGKRGGTMQTVEYAKRGNKKVVIIDPSTLLRVTIPKQGRL